MAGLVVTVVREHGDASSEVVADEQAAREWLVGALYLVEDERLAETAPDPGMDRLHQLAREYGWDIHVQPTDVV